MNETIKKIIEAGTRAPSGDNCQPWKFVFIDPTTIEVHLLAGLDRSLYNFKERGSYLSIGALLENMAIAAPHFGYTLTTTLFPKEQDTTVVAQIAFTHTEEVSTPPLFEAIFVRSTNRKPYSILPPSEELIQKIHNTVTDGYRFVSITNRSSIGILAKAISLNERLMLENRYIHDMLFHTIRWSKEEEQEKKDGLYIKTLELKVPQQKAFKLFRNWKLLSFLNKLGVSKMLPKESSKNYRASGAICSVVMRGLTPKDFVLAGMVIERIWLLAVSEGYSVQPITAIPYLAQRIIENDFSHMDEKHRALIMSSFSVITNQFDIKEGDSIAMVFRLGKGEEPTARAIRIPVEKKIS